VHWLTRRWSTTASYVALFVVVVSTRVPFLRGTGLGADPDAWRLYLTGRVASASGDYAPSRTPGYPAVELVAVAFGHVPWWVYTAATAVVGGVGAVLVAFLARELRVTWWWLVGFGTAFSGVIFVASTTFMDYLWAFAALVGALAADHPPSVARTTDCPGHTTGLHHERPADCAARGRFGEIAGVQEGT